MQNLEKSILIIMSSTFIHMNIAMCPIPPCDDIINNVTHTHTHTQRMIDGQTVIHMYGRTGPNQYPPLLMKTGDNIYFNCGSFNSGCNVIFLFKFIPNLKLLIQYRLQQSNNVLRKLEVGYGSVELEICELNIYNT